MWATTHPFAQTRYPRLTSPETIKAACLADRHVMRLDGRDFDDAVASELSRRLWVCIINPRFEEIIMGTRFRELIAGKMAVPA